LSVNSSHPLFMTTRVSCASASISDVDVARRSRSIYDEMTRADRIIIRLDTVITAYGHVLFHDYLLMPSPLPPHPPQIADICAAQALRTKLIITERVNE